MQFDKLQITADYYDAYLSDMLLAYSETSAAKEVELKALEHYTSGFDKISDFLESSKEYNKLSGSFEIESAFDKGYDISDSMKETFSLVFKDAYQNHPDLFRDIYQGFDCADDICEDINTGLDAYNTFKDCYNAYCVSRATKEVCSEFFDFCDATADEMNKTNPKFAGWFRKNINKFRNNAKSDAELYLATKTAWKAGYLVYDTFIKDLVKDAAYNLVANVLGVAVGKVLAIVAAWNIGTALGDLICGNDTESAYYMYYVSPVEGAMQTVITRYGNTLTSRETFESAYKLDVAFTILKHTNIALYKKVYDYAAKHRILWIKTKTMKNNMEYATQFQEQWLKYVCHNASEPSGLKGSYKTVGVHCPVDVYLYDSSNQLVLSIINEEITTFEDAGITVNVSNKQKAICYSSDSDYRIEIISREAGTMSYSVLSTSEDLVREIETIEIPLVPAQKFIGSIPKSHDAQTDQFELFTDGEAIAPNYDSFCSVRSVELNDIVLNYKSSASIKPSIIADSGVRYTTEYESSNPKVAAVDEFGNIYANKRGNVDITVTVTDQYGNIVKNTCKVTVKYTFIQWVIRIILFGWLWY